MTYSTVTDLNETENKNSPLFLLTSSLLFYTFGYNNLVSDMRSLVILKETSCPVIYDATHSLQLPGGKGQSSDGQSEFIIPVSRGAVGVGIAGIFIETHPDPENALSDGPNSLPLDNLKPLLEQLLAIDKIVKQ